MRRGGAQAREVPIVEERHAVVGAQRFVDAFAVQETVIVDRDDGVLRPRDPAVDVNRAANRHVASVLRKWRVRVPVVVDEV